jgi:hypothetical protein
MTYTAPCEKAAKEAPLTIRAWELRAWSWLNTFQ